MDEKIIKINGDTTQAVTSIKDIRKALKEVQDAMAGLEEGSDAWAELAAKAGEYKHQLTAISEATRGASADFGDMLGNVTKVGAGITGTFQTASAALSLFGVESEEVVKSIKTMQNLMAMTQGLASIDAMQKSLVKLSRSIKSTTAAAKALKVVLQPKVFTAITIAITALTLALNLFKKRQAEAKKASEEAAKVLVEKEAKSVKSAEDAYTRLYNVKQKTYNIKYNGDDVKVYNALLAEQKQELSSVEEEIEKLQTAYGGNGKELRRLSKEIEDSNQKLKDAKVGTEEYEEALINARRISEQYNAAIENLNETDSKYIENIEKLLKKQEDVKDKIEQTTNALREAKIIQDEKNRNYNPVDFRIQELEIQKLLVKDKREEYVIAKKIFDTYREIANETKKSFETTQKEFNNLKATQKDLDKSKQEYIEAQKKEITSQKELNSLFVQIYSNAKSLDEVVENTQYKFEGIGVSLQDILNATDETRGELFEKLGISPEVLDIVKQKISETTIQLARLMDEASGDRQGGVLKQYETEIQYLKALQQAYKEGTDDWLNAQIKINEVQAQLNALQIEGRELDIDIAENKAYQLDGELRQLQERLNIQKEILRSVEETYGAESIEYKSALANTNALKKNLESVKYAAVNVASQGIGFIGDMLGSLADMQDTTTKEGFEQQKKMQIAATTVNGLGAAISAVASWMNPANAWMTAPVQAVMASLNAAAIAASTAAQIKQIAATQFEGGGSVNSSGVGSLTLMPPTDYTTAVSGAQIETNTQTQVAYVSVQEIDKVGMKVSVAEREAFY